MGWGLCRPDPWSSPARGAGTHITGSGMTQHRERVDGRLDCDEHRNGLRGASCLAGTAAASATAEEAAAMTAAFMLSIACLTASLPSRPRRSAWRSRSARSWRGRRNPVHHLVYAFNASNNEISAPVLASAVAPSRSALTIAPEPTTHGQRPSRATDASGRCRGMRSSSARRTTARDEALVRAGPVPSSRDVSRRSGLLAYPLPNDG